MIEPFETLNKKIVYQGRAFAVEAVDVRLPNGKTSKFDIVRHPGAVTIVPVDNEGRILFVRQFRLGAGKDLLELPAGTLEPGEDPDACAAREIQEETGMAAREIKKLGTFYMAPGYSSEYMHVYLAKGLYPSKLEGDADEFLQVEALTTQKVFEMVAKGELLDGKSLAAFLLGYDELKKS